MSKKDSGCRHPAISDPQSQVSEPRKFADTVSNGSERYANVSSGR